MTGDQTATVVEELEIDVLVADHAAFLARDAAVWTTFLGRQPGFLSKEVWRPAERPDVLVLSIRWASREAWKAIRPEVVAEIDAQMGEWYREPRLREYLVVG